MKSFEGFANAQRIDTVPKAHDAWLMERSELKHTVFVNAQRIAKI